MKYEANDIVSQHTEEDGTLWLHVWIEERPGLKHLVWYAPNGIGGRNKRAQEERIAQ